MDACFGYLMDEKALPSLAERSRGRSIVTIFVGSFIAIAMSTMGHMLALRQPAQQTSVHIARTIIHLVCTLCMCFQGIVLRVERRRRTTTTYQLSAAAADARMINIEHTYVRALEELAS